MRRHLVSCGCGNVMECIEEDEKIKPKYRSISGKIRLRCNDCGKDHEVFLRHRIAKFVGGSPSFKEVSPLRGEVGDVAKTRTRVRQG